MSYRSERFNNAMRSVNCEIIDPAKNRAVSDKGLGVEHMIDAIDYDDESETAREKYFEHRAQLLAFFAKRP